MTKTELADTQIAKEPMYQYDNYDKYGNLISHVWVCPTCGVKHTIGFYDYNYCPYCGQEIEWDGEE